MLLDKVNGREDLRIFWAHGDLEPRTERGQESEEVIFIFIVLLPWSISKSTSIVVTHSNQIFHTNRFFHVVAFHLILLVQVHLFGMNNKGKEEKDTKQ